MPVIPGNYRRPAQNPNAGLESLLGNLQRFNAGDKMALGPRPPVAPTAPGMYAQGLRGARAAGTPGMGLMDNYGAAQNYQQTGYQPNMTVGGAWGQGIGGQLPVVGGSASLGRPMLTGPAAERQMMATATMRGIASRPTGYSGPVADVDLNRAYVAPSQTVLDANKASYDARRAEELGLRRENRRALGLKEGEARRVDRGRLTYDERLLAAQPGLGIARERAGAMRDMAGIEAGAQRDVAGINAGVADRRTAAEQEMHQAQLEVEKFKSEGNWRAAARAQRRAGKIQRDITQMQGEYGLQGIAMQTEAGLQRANAEAEQAERDFGLRAGTLRQQQADSYQARADQAYEQGNYTQGDRFQAQADSYRKMAEQASMQGQPQAAGGPASGAQPPAAGIPAPPSPGNGVQGAGRSLPPEVRQQIASQFKSNPQALVSELRRRGMTDQEINMELAQIYGESGLGIAPGGYYSRTADDPTGWGFQQVDPSTGEAGYGLLGTLGSALFAPWDETNTPPPRPGFDSPFWNQSGLLGPRPR